MPDDAIARPVAAERGLLRFLTCGSVDDGKSTLIGRLLFNAELVLADQMEALERESRRFGTTGGDIDFSLLLDGLEDERQQRITIDVAYRFFATPRRSFIVADTPGHEQYTRNMVTGASTADLAVLLVDARKGVLTQTRRHSLVCSLLGIRHIVLAINKMDLVDYSQATFDAIVAGYREFANGIGLANFVAIPIAARDGDNVASASAHMPWYEGATLIEHLDTVDVEVDRATLPFRMCVQWVNRPNASFRGFCGTIASGALRRGDPVFVLPGKRQSRIARIVTHDGDLDEAVEVTLTREAIERAGIKTTLVRAGAATGAITVPGTVTSNAYQETKATALVGGIIKTVTAELGASVSRGQSLAVVVSTDLADAQMKYLSAQAMRAADHQKLTRTEKLVALGAASRQELDDITAAHAGHETEVAAARQRLLLLGLSSQQVSGLRTADQIVSEIRVASPGNGTVVTRAVNPGQVVTAGQELFVVADLSTVWIIADLYEKDFASVRVGSEATVVVPSTAPIRGRVAYIDPRVDPTTRTAKVRVEVPNPGGALRLGMFANVTFRVPSAAGATLAIPRTAVQAVGSRTVVYVAPDGEEGRFIERVVKLGAPAGDTVEVASGLKPGERVVSEGSFFLRAEVARTRSGG